jgi:hypothetical protein
VRAFRVGFDCAGVIAAESESEVKRVLVEHLRDFLIDLSPVEIHYTEDEDAGVTT